MGWLRVVLTTATVLIVTSLGFIIAASFLDTEERAVPDRLAGFHETQISLPHRGAPIPLFVWYPVVGEGTPELIGQNSLFYGFHALRDAPVPDRKLPVVLVSHGSGGNAVSLGWLASHLATQGAMVVATNHPGTTSRDSTPEATVRIWERPQDLSAILDLITNDAPVGLQPDLDNVAALGFSLGGFSVLSLAGVEASKPRFIEYCATFPDKLDCGWMNEGGLDFDAIEQDKYEQSNLDPRIEAVIAIDPALPLAATPESLAEMALPALVIQLGETKTIPPGMLWEDNVTQMPNAQTAVIPETYHFAFLAECSTLGRIIIGLAGDDNICSDNGTRNRPEIHAEVREKTAAFLAKVLKMDSN